jgi:integrase
MRPEVEEMVQRRVADRLNDEERLYRARAARLPRIKWVSHCEKPALRLNLNMGAKKKTGLTAHSFRHAFISRLAERGLPRETIMKLFGHTSRQGIEPYLHATPESIKRASERITGGDGFLTGVNRITGVTRSITSKPMNKLKLPPAQRVNRG